MSGRDRDMCRQYDSGAAKRKAKEERVARETKVLTKMPKLMRLFFAKSNAGSNPGTDVAEIATTSFKSADDLAEIPPQEHGDVATGVQEYDLVPVSETPHMPETSYSLSNPFSCDMGIWPAHVSDSIREYWALKGSVQCQNLDEISANLLPDLGREIQSAVPKRLVYIHSPAHKTATFSHLSLLLAIEACSVLFCLQTYDRCLSVW